MVGNSIGEKHMKSNNEIKTIETLKKTPIRNVNMINFITNYEIEFSYESGNAIMVAGTSDKLWVYINAETKSDFERLASKLVQFNYFAVINDKQLKWFKDIMDYEIIMSCAKFFLPEEVRVEESSSLVSIIDESYSQYILDNYEYKDFVDINYIKGLISNNLVLGIFDNEKLIAWIMTHDDGAMGVLTVLPEYQRRGYATLLSNAYIRYKRVNGDIPFIHIEEDNIKSLNLAKKSGFKYYDRVHWVKKI